MRLFLSILLLPLFSLPAQAQHHHHRAHHRHHVVHHHVPPPLEAQQPLDLLSFFGLASFYGPERVACRGMRYGEYTAAHRTLPCGTLVRVTNRRNGKAVEVKIVDRGPSKWTGRSIDLSHNAAKAIDMIHAGVAQVDIEVLRRVAEDDSDSLDEAIELALDIVAPVSANLPTDADN